MTALLTETARDLTRRLGEELRRQEGERLKRQVLRDLVGSADALAGITLSAWAWVCETLEKEGLEGHELPWYCQVLRNGIDGILAGYERLLAEAVASDLTSNDAGVHALEAKLPALREARPKIAKILDFATQPARPVDEVLLAESQGALDRGEFVDIDDEYIAHLRAGMDM